jgi:hypothetical protein
VGGGDRPAAQDRDALVVVVGDLAPRAGQVGRLIPERLLQRDEVKTREPGAQDLTAREPVAVEAPDVLGGDGYNMHR